MASMSTRYGQMTSLPRTDDERDALSNLYLHSIPPSETRYYPQRLVDWEQGGFQNFKHSTTDPIGHLRSSLRKWRISIRTHLFRQAITARDSIFYKRPLREQGSPSLLDLAVATFSCPSCSKGHHIAACLVGWPALLAHSCIGHSRPDDYDTHDSLAWSSKAHRSAIDLLSLLDLDPLTTTAADMDALDRRFACQDCDDVRPGFRKALKWRECVSSFHESCCTRLLQSFYSSRTRSMMTVGNFQATPAIVAGYY